MLGDRLRTSAILISIVLGLIYLDSSFSPAGAAGIWLLPLLLFFTLGTAWDFTSLLIQSGRRVARPVVMFVVGMIAASAAIPLAWPLMGENYPVNCPVGRLGWIVVAAIAGIFLILIREMVVYGKAIENTETQNKNVDSSIAAADATGGAIERTAYGVLIASYVGLPMAMLVSLRMLGDGAWGLAALITMIATTKSADAGAYFTGKAIGKNKLIPRLSPGKTREGALGGILASTLVAMACLAWLMPGVGRPGTTPSIVFLADPVWGAMVLGPLLAVSGMAGDLAESLVKRDTGAKDSGGWLPGLGGVWDVTDSLIAAVMPAYLCFAAGVGW